MEAAVGGRVHTQEKELGLWLHKFTASGGSQVSPAWWGGLDIGTQGSHQSHTSKEPRHEWKKSAASVFLQLTAHRTGQSLPVGTVSLTASAFRSRPAVAPTISPKVFMIRRLWEPPSFQKITIAVCSLESNLKPDVCRRLPAGPSVFPNPSRTLPCTVNTSLWSHFSFILYGK